MSQDLWDLPLDLILPCFEGSFCLGVQLAGVNKELKLKMEEVSSAGWLRLCATGAAMAKRAELRTHLHVGELVLCTGYRACAPNPCTTSSYSPKKSRSDRTSATCVDGIHVAACTP